MVPAQDPKICPVCGDTVEGGCHPCPGPRQQDPGSLIESRFSDLAKGAELVMLPGDEGDPEDVARALRGARLWHQEEAS